MKDREHDASAEKEAIIKHRILSDIRTAIVYLLNVLNSSDEIKEDKKASIIELTFNLGRNVLTCISDDAFIHAFRASLAIQQFLVEADQLDRLAAKEHLLAIREIIEPNQLMPFKEPRKILANETQLREIGGAQ